MAISSLGAVFAIGPIAALITGLIFLLLGERAFSHTDGFSTVITAFGLILILGGFAVRVLGYIRGSAAMRRAERIILISYVGVLIALFGYFLTTKTGLGMIGVTDEEAIARFTTSMNVLWLIMLTTAMIPMLMVEVSVGLSSWRRFMDSSDGNDGGNVGVELFRVKELATNGLTIAFALSFLMVTCNVAQERNTRWDVSYFKTSSPGSATVKMAESLNENLKILLFFPEVNEVHDEVNAYFSALGQSAGGKLEIESHDRLASPNLAKEHKVNKDGTIVLVRGDKSEKFQIKTDIKQARRTELREFDQKVQKALMKVIREKKIAYFTTGHGELNDPLPDRPLVDADPGLVKASVVKQWLRTLNYEVKDLGIGKPIPDNATIILVLSPTSDFLPEELEGLDKYLAGGGALLLSLDPIGTSELGPLEGRLGIKFFPSALVDDKEYLRRRGTSAEKEFILTNQFSAHASVTSASRGRARSGIVLFKSGSLEDADFTGSAAKRKRTYTVRSVASTYRDVNGNRSFDSATEKKTRYNLVAAIEDPEAGKDAIKDDEAPPPKDDSKDGKDGKDGKDDEKASKTPNHRGMRAIVMADGELFSDRLMHPRAGLPLVQQLVVDSVKWLGGEEEFIGETKSEKDVRIVHTKNQDAAWFYATIFGAPLLFLGLGLLMRLLRRRKS